MKKYSNELLRNFTLEELEKFDDEQLLFPIDVLQSLLRMREAEKKEDERIDAFWQTEYPKLSLKEKAKHWSGELFSSMRMQEEAGQNAYSIYSEKWLKGVLEQDSNFVELLPHIYNLWGGMFDSGKVDRIIKRHLKNISKNG